MEPVHEGELLDLPCSVPVYARTDLHRRSTRYYDWNYLNYATITGTTRFSEPFGVPGDPSTFTVITEGVPSDLQPVGGPSLYRTVGTIVEPPGEVGTFTGHVTENGVTTRYDDAPLPELMSDEEFVSNVCEAVTGTP